VFVEALLLAHRRADLASHVEHAVLRCAIGILQARTPGRQRLAPVARSRVEQVLPETAVSTALARVEEHITA